MECFQKRYLHILYLNVTLDCKAINSLTIGIGEPKLVSSISNSEADIVGYDVIRMDRSWRGGGVVCYIKNHLIIIVRFLP